jgi:hypothetical protein
MGPIFCPDIFVAHYNYSLRNCQTIAVLGNYLPSDTALNHRTLDSSNKPSFSWSTSSHGATAPSGPGPPHYWGFTITLRQRNTLGRSPLDEWSARRRDLYLTTHNTHKRQTSMTPAGFEPVISASERPQTHALDRAATGIDQSKT